MTYIIIIAIVFCLILALFFQPRWLFYTINFLIPEVIYFKKTDQPILALTIDDIPNSETTPLILDVLRQYDVKATFFVISSQISGNEKIMKEIVAAGHELGNHMTEDKPSIKLSTEEFAQDLQKAHSTLSKFSEIKWMRPASGWYNAAMLKVAQKNNYRVALGSIFPYDTQINSSWFAINHIFLNVQPGSIIVLHDGDLRGNRTALILEEILPKLKQRGYKFATLSELFSE